MRHDVVALREHALEKPGCGLQGAGGPCRARLVRIAGDTQERLSNNDWMFWGLWRGMATDLAIGSHPCHALVLAWVDMMHMDFHFLSLCRKV